jgi:two-component system sensor histidine kinase KdpD
LLGTAAVTALLAPFHEQLSATTVALVLLLVVLFAALLWGSRPALLASVLAAFGLNLFFLPPLYTLSIAHLQNWVALAAFFTTALAVGQLSARARMRAEEAESGKLEIERLYRELQEAFERASQAEALKRSEKLKSALLDAVTHDLRTPLASIKASITTLLDESRQVEGDEPVILDRDSRLEMLEVIDEETDRLTRFIGGLIELARIEAGEMELRRQWGVVDEIISNALLRAQPITKGRQINLEIEDELPLVRVDERAVSEVLYSLIDNAAKYSPPGTEIKITAHRDQEGTIKLAVEDRGKGVPFELRERVFDKFFRATRDGDISKQQPSGTGMGLAIAKGIVEAHEGRIWIESSIGGEGTRVAFILPIGDEEGEVASYKQQATHSGS